MFDDPAVLAERLAAAAPSSHVTPDGRVAILPDLDPGEVWTDRLVALDRVKAAAEAEQMMVLAAMREWATDWVAQADAERAARSATLADRVRDSYAQPTAEEVVADHVAPALRLSPTTAAIRADRAYRIVSRLPGSLGALRRGEIDFGRLMAIDDATRELDDTAAGQVEERVLPKAGDQTAAELRAALRKAVIAVDPDGAERRRKAAVRSRKVVRYAGPDGTSVLQATLSAIDTGEIYDLVDEVARRTKTSDDLRSVDQRRADAFVHLLLGRDPSLGPEDDPPPPDQPPPPDEPPPGPGDEPPHLDDPGDDDPGDGDGDGDTDDTDDLDTDDGADDPPAAGRGADRRDSQPDVTDPVDPGLADDPGMGEPADLDERFAPIPDRISELAALALSAMISRRPPALPWVAINATTGPDGSLVLVGELAGYGPITSEAAFELILTGAGRVRDHPTGPDPTDAQARTHDPPTALAREIRARDGTCRFPGCRRAAHRVDLDHTVAFPRGLTVRENLAGLCRRHHRTKTAGVWHLSQDPDGSGTLVWTSNLTGQRYLTAPRGTNGSWTGSATLAA